MDVRSKKMFGSKSLMFIYPYISSDFFFNVLHHLFDYGLPTVVRDVNVQKLNNI